MGKFFNHLKLALKPIAILVLFIIQLCAFQALYYASEYLSDQGYWWGTLLYLGLGLALFITTVVFFLRVLYSREDAEFRIPWLLVLALLPGLGIMIYIVFRQRDLKRSQKKLLKNIKEAYKPYFKSELHKERLNDNYNEPINFLESLGTFQAHYNNRIEYYSCGEEWFPEFIEKLKTAKEFIFMEFFIIHEGKEWGQIHEVLKQKAAEGVEVRLLYDDVGCLSTLSSTYARKLRKEGIKAYRFNKVGLIVSGTYNNRSHRKIAVIDHTYGYTGGMNLGDEYANDIVRFGYWKDTMIRIEGSAINNLIALFLTNFDLTVKEVSDYGKYLGYEYPKFDSKSLIYPFGTGPENMYKVRVGDQNYVNLIECAMHTLYISTPYLIPSTDILNSIQRAAYRGVDVKLFIPGIPDKKAVYKVAKFYMLPLLEAGVKVYFYTPGFNHMKTLLADDMAAFVGTINLDYRSLVHHYECGATIIDGDVMSKIRQDFENMEKVSTLVPKDYKLKKREKFLCLILRVFMPLM